MLTTFNETKIRTAANHILGAEKYIKFVQDSNCLCKLVIEAALFAFQTDCHNDSHIEYIRAALRSIRSGKGIPLED